MANLKDIKRRIGSVKNTQQITKAMKLVAAARLRKAQEAATAARPYADKLQTVMESLGSRAATEEHPLLKRRDVRNVLLVVIGGDKGLCGPFNTNVFKASQKVIAENEGRNVSVYTVGKKAVDFFDKPSFGKAGSKLDYGKHLNIEFARDIARAVIDQFIEEKVDAVYLVYNKFKNVVVQIPTTVPLLPIAFGDEKEEKDPEMVDYEYEPSAEAILGGLLEVYVENQIFQSLLESAASENGARMTAMDAATRNAKEMIENLTLVYNQARQAAITTEIIEVVSGADALG